MGVDVKVTSRADGQIKAGVAGQRIEHVIEETDAGGDVRTAGAVNVQRHLDSRLFGLAADLSGPAA
jgi:hypothetical protein